MPCRCDGYEDMQREERRKTTDQLTQDLCYLCGALTEAGVLVKYASPRILKWWKQHQKDDNARVREDLRDVLEDYWHDHQEILSAERLAEGAIETAESEHPVSDFHKKWFHVVAEQVRTKWIEKKKRKLLDEKQARTNVLETFKRQADTD